MGVSPSPLGEGSRERNNFFWRGGNFGVKMAHFRALLVLNFVFSMAKTV